MSLNSSLYTSFSGLAASQVSLSVTTNNMLNANTIGYSKQQAITASIQAPQSSVVHQVGNGVKIQEVRRISDQFLKASCRSSYQELGQYGAKAQYLNEIETAYGDLYGYNISSSTDEFLHAWEDLSKNPSSQTARASVYQTGVAFCDMYNQYQQQLSAIESTVASDYIGTVDQINQLCNEIASLNQEISSYPSNVPLEILDYRDTLLDELSSMVSCNISYQSDGTVDIISDTGLLVFGDKHQTLKIESTPPKGLPSVKWEDGNEFTSESGSLRALNDFLYNQTSPSIEEIESVLNKAMVEVAAKINELHQSGLDLNGNPGFMFFVPINAELPLDMGNIQVNPLLSDENLIVAGQSGLNGDGEIAKAISDLSTLSFITFDGTKATIDEYLSSYTQWLGSIAEGANGQHQYHAELTLQLNNQYQALSSVSTDEEMANMMVFQQAYNANANVMNTINDLMDDLLRKLG